MVRLSASVGFTPIPEGEHIFKIIDTKEDKEFGIIDIKMVTEDGKKHNERYRLLKKDFSLNEASLKHFSMFARIALHDFNATDIEVTDLIGKFIKCQVTHNKVKSIKEGEGDVIFVNLGYKSEAYGFEQDAVPTNNSLDDLLSI